MKVSSLLEEAFKQVVSPKEATARSYAPITTSYNASEWWMLHNAIQSLANGSRKYLLVLRIDGHEIWIPKSERKVSPTYEAK